MRSVQYIVVGQGLAGSCVALQLLRQQKSFVVISTPEHSRSSIVAAGLFNPVTGQNLVKTWMCDIIFPYLQKFYREAESLTGEDFFHNVPLYRPFVSAEEQNTWMARTVDPEYSGLIDRVSDGPFNRGISDPMGGLWVKNSGYIETAAFLSAVRELLKKKGLYIEELFDYSRLEVRNDVLYGDLTSARVIFCEGYRLSENPWFKKVPLRPLKGETIDIKSGFSEHVILNRGVYMVPGKSPGSWRVGSTYNSMDKTTQATPAARLEMEQKLKQLVNFTFEVEAQDWGIRPTTNDRRPILGSHPDYQQLLVFNGLGTKGVTLAPYFSEVLIHWIENRADSLNKEVNVTRFKSLY